jgi:hypothetical protein
MKKQGESRQNFGKVMAFDKSKAITYFLGLKQVMRFLKGYENDDDDKGEKWG